jgi:hypothetical protein
VVEEVDIVVLVVVQEHNPHNHNPLELLTMVHLAVLDYRTLLMQVVVEEVLVLLVEMEGQMVKVVMVDMEFKHLHHSEIQHLHQLQLVVDWVILELGEVQLHQHRVVFGLVVEEGEYRRRLDLMDLVEQVVVEMEELLIQDLVEVD